jgi:hypothetical protein
VRYYKPDVVLKPRSLGCHAVPRGLPIFLGQQRQSRETPARPGGTRQGNVTGKIDSKFCSRSGPRGHPSPPDFAYVSACGRNEHAFLH